MSIDIDAELAKCEACDPFHISPDSLCSPAESAWLASAQANYEAALHELLAERQARERVDETDALRAECERLKLIVRARTHRERGCLCEKCVSDEYQTARVVESLRSEVERLKASK